MTAAAKRWRRGSPSTIRRRELDGFLVQEMVDGLEVIVGVRDDPQFGPFMLFGLGGVLVEVLNDIAIRLLPIDEATAHEMIRSLRGAALFDAFRGRPPRDVGAVVRAMTGLSRLFIDHRAWLSDLEINPLIVLAEGEGVRAVDVRAVVRKPKGAGAMDDGRCHRRPEFRAAGRAADAARIRVRQFVDRELIPIERTCLRQQQA